MQSMFGDGFQPLKLRDLACLVCPPVPAAPSCNGTHGRGSRQVCAWCRSGMAYLAGRAEGWGVVFDFLEQRREHPPLPGRFSAISWIHHGEIC